MLWRNSASLHFRIMFANFIPYFAKTLINPSCTISVIARGSLSKSNRRKWRSLVIASLRSNPETWCASGLFRKLAMTGYNNIVRLLDGLIKFFICQCFASNENSLVGCNAAREPSRTSRVAYQEVSTALKSNRELCRWQYPYWDFVKINLNVYLFQ